MRYAFALLKGLDPKKPLLSLSRSHLGREAWYCGDMVQRADPFAPDEWYHCYNRGVDKRIVFTNPKDYERFLMLLYACNSREPIHISNIYRGKTLVDLLEAVDRKKTLVDIGAYCLMPNHFHLLVRVEYLGDTLAALA